MKAKISLRTFAFEVNFSKGNDISIPINLMEHSLILMELRERLPSPIKMGNLLETLEKAVLVILKRIVLLRIVTVPILNVLVILRMKELAF